MVGGRHIGGRNYIKMTYELAKKLKDAGFTQTGKLEHIKGTISEFMVFPTLSELIEVCGDEFCYLQQAENNEWIATSKAIVGSTEMCSALEIHLRGEFDNTPEEAVANLWLALKKNQK